MTRSVRDFLEDYHAFMRKAKQVYPEASRAFGGMFEKLMKGGALSPKVKELIALGISVESRCRPCIYLHVQKSLDMGATPQEVMEAAGVAVMMRGGPAYTQLPSVAKALEELAPACHSSGKA